MGNKYTYGSLIVLCDNAFNMVKAKREAGLVSL